MTAFQKMRFRGDIVFVLVDEAGQPVLDREGRAEMKYREDDTRTYRPQPANLVSVPTIGDGGGENARALTKGPPAGRQTLPKAAAAATRARPSSASPDTAAAYHVWTDGACSGNPGPMGIGVVVVAGDEREEIGEYLGIGTNNIAELVAIERGLELVSRRLAATPGRLVRVYSDSSYAIGVLDKAWKAKANREVVARIRALLSAFPGKPEFVKVRGHAGIPENERCDALGREAIARSRR